MVLDASHKRIPSLGCHSQTRELPRCQPRCHWRRHRMLALLQSPVPPAMTKTAPQKLPVGFHCIHDIVWGIFTSGRNIVWSFYFCWLICIYQSSNRFWRRCQMSPEGIFYTKRPPPRPQITNNSKTQKVLMLVSSIWTLYQYFLLYWIG